jgi:hypothetical protein
MLKTKAKLDHFITLLLQIGLYPIVDGQRLHVSSEHIYLTASTCTRLARFGLTLAAGKTETVVTCDAFPNLFPAWTWLAAEAPRTAPTTDKAHVPPIHFSHCLYSDTCPYARDVFQDPRRLRMRLAQ